MSGDTFFEVPPENDVRLSDEEVALRIEIYNGDGKLQRDLRLAWDKASSIILRVAERHFREFANGPLVKPVSMGPTALLSPDGAVASVLRLTEQRFTDPVDATWIERVAALARSMYSAKLPLPVVVNGLARYASSLAEALREAFSDDAATLRLLTI